MKKPKLLYFSPGERYREHIVPNNHEPILGRIDRWLTHFFDVVVQNESCDFAEKVKHVQPDYILFDGLIESLNKLRIHLTNIHAFPEIPRASLGRVDAISPSRGTSFEEGKRYGAEVQFVIGDLAMGQSLTEVKNQIMYVPWYIDPEICKDYEEQKTTPILMVGNFEKNNEFYPWRKSVRDTLLDNFPALYFRHPGYDPKDNKVSPLILFGEKFFRAINRSLVAPSSGGFTEIVVSKQIEIPACRTLLVTNDTEAVRAYGFRNYENCLMVNAANIKLSLEKMFKEPEFLQQITDAGFKLVHTQHTFRQRQQLLQWFELRRSLPKGHKIIQPTLFGNLEVMPAEHPKTTYHMTLNPINAEVKVIDECLRKGHYIEAEARSRSLYSFCSYIAEPAVRLSLAQIAQGNPGKAVESIQKSITTALTHGRLSPDPIEWSILLFSLLALGDITSLRSMYEQFQEVERRELDLVRWIIAIGLEQHDKATLFEQRVKNPTNQCLTIHEIPFFSNEVGFSVLCQILSKSRQARFAERIANLVPQVFAMQHTNKLGKQTPASIFQEKETLNEVNNRS